MSEHVNRADELWRVQTERKLMDLRNTAKAEKFVNKLNYSCVRCGQNEEMVRLLQDGFICEHCLTTKYDLKGTDLQAIKIATMEYLQCVSNEDGMRANRIFKKVIKPKFTKFFYVMREYGLLIHEVPFKHSLFMGAVSETTCTCCGKKKLLGVRLKQFPLCLPCSFVLSGHNKKQFERMWSNSTDYLIKDDKEFK